MARQISQTLNAVSECWNHPFSENQCCGAVPWSDLGAVIDIPCYFRPKSRGSIFVQNNMGCLWQPLDLTTWLLHNIGFPKGGGFSIQKLHSKSVIFAVPLNFQNSTSGQPATTHMTKGTNIKGSMQVIVNDFQQNCLLGISGRWILNTYCVLFRSACHLVLVLDSQVR